MPEILTAAEVADLLRVSVPTVYRWYANGELPGIRVGRSLRFRREDILGRLEPREVAS